MLTDSFALLGQARRPWLDPQQVKIKFLALSAEVHPDRVHNASPSEKAAAQENYTRLNAAYNCLRDPRARLAHLIELEGGAKPGDVQNIPPDLMDLYLAVSGLRRDAEAILEEKQRIVSPLLQVEVFQRGQAQLEKIRGLQLRLNSLREELDSELRKIDADWVDSAPGNSTARSGMLERIESLCPLFGYLARWTNQLEECSVQLSV